MEKSAKLKPGKYRHYKGKYYEVIGVAHHSETREALVVYRCLYGDYSLWVRPLEMFTETVTVNDSEVLRFSWCSDDGIELAGTQKNNPA